MEWFHNIRAFVTGFAKGWRYTYVNHFSAKVYPYRHFWYECGYGLSYAIDGWYSLYHDDYAVLKRGEPRMED